jgi:hypothetical protein
MSSAAESGSSAFVLRREPAPPPTDARASDLKSGAALASSSPPHTLRLHHPTRVLLDTPDPPKNTSTRYGPQRARVHPSRPLPNPSLLSAPLARPRAALGARRSDRACLVYAPRSSPPRCSLVRYRGEGARERARDVRAPAEGLHLTLPSRPSLPAHLLTPLSTKTDPRPITSRSRSKAWQARNHS